jgi:hypothetical protein
MLFISTILCLLLIMIHTKRINSWTLMNRNSRTSTNIIRKSTNMLKNPFMSHKNFGIMTLKIWLQFCLKWTHCQGMVDMLSMFILQVPKKYKFLYPPTRYEFLIFFLIHLFTTISLFIFVIFFLSRFYCWTNIKLLHS